MTILEAAITCPQCSHVARETMPTNACLYFYECLACRTLLRPRPGDCCVFCSFSDQRCPPKQTGGCGSTMGQGENLDRRK